MKNHCFILLACLLHAFSSRAQFIIVDPGIATHTIEDIKVSSGGQEIFATDQGILIHNATSWTHFDTTNGMGEEHATAIGPYSGGFLYSTVNKRTGYCNYTAVADAPFGISDTFDYISAMHIDATGDTLYGTDNGLVFLRNSTTHAPVAFGATLGNVVDIEQLHNASGTVNFQVIATGDKAVIYQVSTGLGILVDSATTPIPTNKFLSNTVSNAVIYGGTDKGIAIADFTNYPVLAITIINTANAPIPSDSITAIQVSGNDMYIGTPNGLGIFKDSAWITFNTANSNLPSNDITKLALNNDTLWLATSAGVICKFGISQVTNAVKSIAYNNKGVAAYPNPCSTALNVSCNDPGMQAIRASLTDAAGRTCKYQETGKASLQFDTTDLEDGIYYLEVYTRQGVYSEKILVAH